VDNIRAFEVIVFLTSDCGIIEWARRTFFSDVNELSATYVVWKRDRIVYIREGV
jgi:hypothetical protein